MKFWIRAKDETLEDLFFYKDLESALKAKLPLHCYLASVQMEHEDICEVLTNCYGSTYCAAYQNIKIVESAWLSPKEEAKN